MKRTHIFLSLFLIIILTSCSKQIGEEKDIVKIWWYKHEQGTVYNHIIERAIERIKTQAFLDDAEIDIKEFSHSDLSYDDYILKRNLAIEHNDLDIAFDTSTGLYSLRGKEGSYDKMKNYENIFDNFKNQYCVPLCTDLRVNFVNNDVLRKYNIQPENAITLDEYYEIKQRMKESGAKFKLNAGEFNELIDYYYRKNDLKISKDQKGLYVDKTAVMTAVSELVDDIKDNYEYDYIIKDVNDFEYKIIEEKSGYQFSGFHENYLALNYNDFSGRPPIKDYTIVISDNYSAYTIPCLFIPKNSKNDSAYAVSDALFSDGFQISLYDSGYGGVITNLDSKKDLIGFDEDWNYIGVRNLMDEDGNLVGLRIYPNGEEEKLHEVLTKGYEIIRNTDMSCFFSNINYYGSLNRFVSETAVDAIKNEKTLEDFDKMADDFIINLNISGN